jgi:hypothetical protein
MSQNSHQTAATITAAIADTTPAEQQFLRCVAWHETRYGAKWSGSGINSNNWGAITGKGDAGSFSHGDSTPTATGQQKYVTSFAKYSSPLEGARGLARTLLKPVTRSAIAHGSLIGAVAAMYGYGYYAGFSLDPTRNVMDYANRVADALALIVSSTSEPPRFAHVLRTPDAVAQAWAALGTGQPLRSGVLRGKIPVLPTFFFLVERHVVVLEVQGPIGPAVTRSGGKPLLTTSLENGTWSPWRKAEHV